MYTSCMHGLGMFTVHYNSLFEEHIHACIDIIMCIHMFAYMPSQAACCVHRVATHEHGMLETQSAFHVMC